MSETKESERSDRDPVTGRFLQGNTGNPYGRPKGARNKLGEAFTLALAQDFEAHGMSAIVQCREMKPDAYLKVIASLMPRDMNLNISDAREATDEELLARIRSLDAVVRPFLESQGQPRH